MAKLYKITARGKIYSDRDEEHEFWTVELANSAEEARQQYLQDRPEDTILKVGKGEDYNG